MKSQNLVFYGNWIVTTFLQLGKKTTFTDKVSDRDV